MSISKSASLPFVRSDDLPQIVEVIEFLRRLLRDSVKPREQFKVVIDAAMAVSVMSFHARKNKADARTDIEELVSSGVVIAYAPDWIEREIDEHLPDYAAQWGHPIEKLKAAWIAFRAQLRLLPERDLPTPSRAEHENLKRIDPNDLPFAMTLEAVGAIGVLSKDHHFARAGIPVVTTEVIIDLREYARSKTVELYFRAGGQMFALSTAGVAIGVGKAVVEAARLIARAPLAVQVALAIGTIALVAHPTSRGWIWEGIKKTGGVIAETWPLIEPKIHEALAEHARAEEAASRALESARGKLPASAHRPTLKAVAFGVLVAADAPLRLDDVKSRVLAQGYMPKGSDFTPYLQQVLRSDERLVSGADGWTVRHREQGKTKAQVKT